MIAHQTEGVAGPVELIDDSGKDIEKDFAVGVIIKNSFPSVTPGSEVIQCIGEFVTLISPSIRAFFLPRTTGIQSLIYTHLNELQDC